MNRLLRPSASRNPITQAAASETSVSSRARIAPCQYGLDVNASQKTWVSKLASTRRTTYFTSAAGIWCLVAIFFSVPFFFSALIAPRRAVPSFLSAGR